MEVWSSAMGPERVLPSSEDELGEEERPAEGGMLPAGGVAWPGGEEGENGGGMEVDGEEEEEEEEEEEVNSGGYYYQPLNQEPSEEQQEEPSHAEALQEVQHRIEVMGLHLPEAPPPDSDDEDDSEVAAAQQSRASIPMDADHVELVKRTMAAVALPSLGVPPWAREISDDQWKDMVQHTLESRQSAAALRLPRRSNVP
ncbi:male-enhanced antigen 1 [Salarias fasciatus]|nr:male-enhanced antigen 1 [Salarias fasciatus]XP_029963398.1 male-enhanced antigen 1 [Salarias fasciatus]XP_029963399.1 male-enhanced antigen 1 [Salarias fasciatus]XP_029963400.1 male-enhanced antigen 1 [Salarias fasciatus]XP_029963401.1 male-enhanced antigen 1 [Salarias fasciatus]